MLEKDLFPPLKKHFKEKGYKVYAEVPSDYHSVDFVAVKGDEQIAVEMKTHFSKGVVYQASGNCHHFTKSYVAVPTRPREESDPMTWCRRSGIGILQVYPKGTILYVLEATVQKVDRLYDFSTFKENDGDEAGIQFNKGKSSAFVVLDRVIKYVTENPRAGWHEIFDNVQNHYSSPRSLRGAMAQWKGFNLEQFKVSLFQNQNDNK